MRVFVYSLLFLVVVGFLFFYTSIQHVLAIPEIQVSCNEIRFTADPATPTLPAQTFQITNNKKAKLSWSVRIEKDPQEDAYGMQVSPPQGTCKEGRPQKVEVRVYGKNPRPGRYHYVLTVMGDTSEIERKKIDVYVDATKLPVHAGNTGGPAKNFKILRVPEEYSSIGKAMDAAQNGDKIIVGQGTYYENLRFEGKNIVLESAHPNDSYAVSATVIRGSMGAGSVITFSGQESPACRLSGFTITAGEAKYGGGINGNGTHATITYCVIYRNSAEYGGAIYNTKGLIANCKIEDNRSTYGGALNKVE